MSSDGLLATIVSSLVFDIDDDTIIKRKKEKRKTIKLIIDIHRKQDTNTVHHDLLVQLLLVLDLFQLRLQRTLDNHFVMMD